MKKKNWILGLLLLAGLAAIVYFGRGRIHFNWHVFIEQIAQVSWWRIAIGVSMIWLAYWIRAARWSVLLSPMKKSNWRETIGPQVIGYTGVALLGRPADLMRPYLTAKKLKTTVSAQLAVYVVERMFDLDAFALIFSGLLSFAPDKKTMPHPELVRHFAMIGLIATIGVAVLAASVRLGGNAMARGSRSVSGGFAPKLGEGIASKILAFRSGLEVLASVREVALAFGQSLLMWSMITVAYLETAHAFAHSPQLHTLTLTRCMLLMGASMAASTVQLPVIGWFTQIAAVAAVFQGFFGVPAEPSLGCSAMLLIVTYLSVVPMGLIWARVERISLREVAAESEHAGEVISEEKTQAL
ncbi:MAG: lysylphosphatidylglycerol synthase transmembrane domain-containing protein [Acidobacteriaceae bacterium]